MESNEKTIWDLLKKPSDLRNNEVDPYEFDRRKEDRKNIKERNEEYTKILIEYRDYFTKSLSFKTRCKKVSVFIFLGVLIAVVLAHCISIAVMVNRGFDMNTLVACISASVSLITALLVIPTKIIEFIFNRDEEKYFVEIIRNIQDYDKKVRDDFKALAS